MWVTLLGMLVYGVIHSALAGWIKPQFKARFGDRAYHGLYRIAFNIIAVLTLLPVALAILVVDRNSTLIWQLPSSLESALWVIRIIGLAGIAFSLIQIDTRRFIGLSQLRAFLSGQVLPLPDEPLQTGGLYRLVRHPLYLFSLMLIWPMSEMRGGYFGFCLGTTAYFVFGSLLEERRLLSDYGPAYADYRRQVAWLIPFVWLPAWMTR